MQKKKNAIEIFQEKGRELIKCVTPHDYDHSMFSLLVEAVSPFLKRSNILCNDAFISLLVVTISSVYSISLLFYWRRCWARCSYPTFDLIKVRYRRRRNLVSYPITFTDDDHKSSASESENYIARQGERGSNGI